MSQLRDQTLALAGLFQAAILTEELAFRGQCGQAAFDCSFDSLFAFDAESTAEIYGDLKGLGSGFEALIAYLGGQNQQSSKNIAYYLLAMIKLSKRVVADRDLSDGLQRELQSIEANQREFGLSRVNAISKIDALYQNHISQLSPRIMVRGDEHFLRDDDVAARVRTLLLAGIRAAVLWMQLGGSRWRLMWRRRQFVACAQDYLNRM